MNQPVEIVTLERGVLQSARTLSSQIERRVGGYAASVAAGTSCAGFAAFTGITWASGFVLHATAFVAAAAGIGAVAAWARWRTIRRVAHYRVGPHMEDDAFAPEALDMVYRRPDGGYELSLVHGMTGVIEDAHSRLPIEGLTCRNRPVSIPLAPRQVARIHLGQTTFIVRCLDRA